jgi:hypothetical protein
MEAAASNKEKQDRDDVKNAFAQLESAVELMDSRQQDQQVPDANNSKKSGGTTSSDHHNQAAVVMDPPTAAGAAVPQAEVVAIAATSYSTRGRPTTQQEQESSSSQLHLHIEAASELLSIAKDLIGGSDHPSRNVVRESFLSDSLTEKEIRTRTRVLPNLDGMHGLRKSEVKSDLSLARGDRPLKTSKRKSRDVVDSSNDMDTDTDNGATASVMTTTTMMMDNTTTTANAAADESNNNDPSIYRTVAIGKYHTLGMPSGSFLPPPAQPATTTANNNNNKRPSPRHVDSIVAYNPPRPPDSLGGTFSGATD